MNENYFLKKIVVRNFYKINSGLCNAAIAKKNHSMSNNLCIDVKLGLCNIFYM